MSNSKLRVSPGHVAEQLVEVRLVCHADLAPGWSAFLDSWIPGVSACLPPELPLSRCESEKTSGAAAASLATFGGLVCSERHKKAEKRRFL